MGYKPISLTSPMMRRIIGCIRCDWIGAILITHLLWLYLSGWAIYFFNNEFGVRVITILSQIVALFLIYRYLLPAEVKAKKGLRLL
jgi:hypothetical protein